MRSGASVDHERALSSVPRGALTDEGFAERREALDQARHLLGWPVEAQRLIDFAVAGLVHPRSYADSGAGNKDRMGGAPTDIQRAWYLIREAADEAAAKAQAYGQSGNRISHEFETGRQAAFVTALHFLEQVDPDADPGEYVPGRVYGPEEDRS